ncbi:MAG: GreA/GreB family elongation factor [Microbacteriaceae bacterium]
MSSTIPVTWLTQAAHDRLTLELQSLQLARKLPATATESAEADSRINHLVALLRTAKVHSPADDGIVEPGMLVEAEIDGELQQFLIGSREIEHGDLDVFSVDSPLGSAINGRLPGDKFSYTAPSGATIAVTIVSAHPFQAA